MLDGVEVRAAAMGRAVEDRGFFPGEQPGRCYDSANDRPSVYLSLAKYYQAATANALKSRL